MHTAIYSSEQPKLNVRPVRATVHNPCHVVISMRWSRVVLIDPKSLMLMGRVIAEWYISRDTIVCVLYVRGVGKKGE